MDTPRHLSNAGEPVAVVQPQPHRISERRLSEPGSQRSAAISALRKARPRRATMGDDLKPTSTPIINVRPRQRLATIDSGPTIILGDGNEYGQRLSAVSRRTDDESYHSYDVTSSPTQSYKSLETMTTEGQSPSIADGPAPSNASRQWSTRQLRTDTEETDRRSAAVPPPSSMDSRRPQYDTREAGVTSSSSTRHPTTDTRTRSTDNNKALPTPSVQYSSSRTKLDRTPDPRSASNDLRSSSRPDVAALPATTPPRSERPAVPSSRPSARDTSRGGTTNPPAARTTRPIESATVPDTNQQSVPSSRQPSRTDNPPIRSDAARYRPPNDRPDDRPSTVDSRVQTNNASRTTVPPPSGAVAGRTKSEAVASPVSRRPAQDSSPRVQAQSQQSQPQPQRPGMPPPTASQMDTQYVNMLLALDDIPATFNLAASFFTWILLAGFILFPGTFTSLRTGHAEGLSGDVLDVVNHVGLFVVAWTCTAIGAIGMCWLWWRWQRNYIWLTNRIFMPGLMNAVAGVVSTLSNVYGVQGGSFGTTSKSTIIVTSATAGVCGILTGVYGFWLLRKVKKAHDREVGKQRAGEHGEGFVDVTKRRVKA